MEIPPVVPSGAAAAVDIYEARAVIDGNDFRIRQFHARGSLLKQPYAISFQLIRREMTDEAAPDDFSIQTGPADLVLEGDPLDEPGTDVLRAALREIARLKANR